jgi:hypothetical protein
MDILELEQYNLADAVELHRELNPKLFDGDHLRPEVRTALLKIAQDFQEHLGVDNLKIKDITISGSNASYAYTPHSDIDLHLVVDMSQFPDNEIYKELFDAKKYQYNETHDITVRGYDVELYVQDADQAHHSAGIYSLVNDDWVKLPVKQRVSIKDRNVKQKYESLKTRIDRAVKSGNEVKIEKLFDKIKDMRKAGLEKTGEFGPENLAYKMLRTQGLIDKLVNARQSAKSDELSIDEAGLQESASGYIPSKKQAKDPRWSHALTVDVGPDAIQKNAKKLGMKTTRAGLPPIAKPNGKFQAIKESKDHSQKLADLKKFIGYVVKEVGIDPHDLPPIRFTDNKAKVKQHHTFGTTAWGDGDKYLWVFVGDRNMADVMRTLCHELIHVKQFQIGTAHGGMSEEQEQYIEDEANALAGRYLRKYGKAHEEIYESLLREYEQLDEVKTSPANLEKWSDSADARGIRIGFEVECIMPNVGGGEEEESEPDYDAWDYVSDIEDIVSFFKDNDEWGYNLTDNDASKFREKLWEQFLEWRDSHFDDIMKEEDKQEELIARIKEKLKDDYDYDAEAVEQALKDKSGRDYEECYYNAMDEMRDEFNEIEKYDQKEWLEDMGIENSYDAFNHWHSDLYWPIYTYVDQEGMSMEEIADRFQEDMGIKAYGFDSYHSGSRKEAEQKGAFIFEPDSSLEADSNDEGGVEIVTPPLPLDTAFDTLEKTLEWVRDNNGYTNTSTGLHMNISVPNQTMDTVDYVKLVLFMGDKYLLDRFDRSLNHYCQSAYEQIKKKRDWANKNMPRIVEQLKKGATQLAAKAVHDGQTQKYNSANNKGSYIEFRGPGGDYIDKDIAELKETGLRFARALKIASDPNAYKTEYAKKFYKLLTDSRESKDEIALNKILSEYVAGNIPKDKLDDYVDKLRKQREERKPKDWYIWTYERPDNELGGINRPVIYNTASVNDARDHAEGEYGWRQMRVDTKDAWERAQEYYIQSLQDTSVHPDADSNNQKWMLWSPDDRSITNVVAATSKQDAVSRADIFDEFNGKRADAVPYDDNKTKEYSVSIRDTDVVPQVVYALSMDQAKDLARQWNETIKQAPREDLIASVNRDFTANLRDIMPGVTGILEPATYTVTNAAGGSITIVANSPAEAKQLVSSRYAIPVGELVITDREPLPQLTWLVYSPTLPDIDPIEILAATEEQAYRIARQTTRVFQGTGIDIVKAIPIMTKKFIVAPDFENRPKGQPVPSQIVWENLYGDAITKAKQYNRQLQAYRDNQLMWVTLEVYSEAGFQQVDQGLGDPNMIGNFHLLNHNGSIDRQVTGVTVRQAQEAARNLERELDLSPDSIRVSRI